MHCYQSSRISSEHKTASVADTKGRPSVFEPCASWARNMTSKHPFVSSSIGISVFLLAAVFILVAITQIRRWSSVHRIVGLQLLGKAAHPCEEKALLADD